MLDSQGYRPNVGMILLNTDKQVFWGKRKGEYFWQFPQGGILENENPETAMFRELKEELGLEAKHVKIINQTSDWLHYDVPSTYNRNYKVYKGQKQIWFLLQFTGEDYHINIKADTQPEFDAWRWVNYWLPKDEVIAFKQDVYQRALQELSGYVDVK